MIQTIEEFSMNAWPCLQTVIYDGWILRFAEGYTKRANSINPLYPSSRDVEGKVSACEEVYRRKRLNVVFKMTEAAHPAGLDDLLAARGYRVDSPTSVQVADLVHMDGGSDPPAELTADAGEEWLTAFCRMNAIDPQRMGVLRRMLDNTVPDKCFASFRQGDQIIACGLGVVQDGFLGLYDIVTDREHRRQGYGRRLMLSLLAWGRDHGAQTAYLQVMLNNAPALHLYTGLGFAEVYRYWYRIKSQALALIEVRPCI